MMRRLALFLLLVVAAGPALTGCAGVEGPSPEAVQAIHTFPANYKAEVLAYLRTFLNDPTNVHDAYISEPVLTRVRGIERYVSCVRFDAKSTSGRYRGVRDHLASYYGGKLENFVELRQEAADQCRSAEYQPFPELEQLVRR
jgi:hypothetical protein